MAKKKPAEVKVYQVPNSEPEKKASQGYIKHSWVAICMAAIGAAIVGAIFFWRKRK